MENVSANKGDRAYLELGGASHHFSLEVRNSSNDLCGYRTFRLYRLPGRSSDLGSLRCCLRGRMKAVISYGVKVGTRHALLGRIVDMHTKSGPVSRG